MPNPFDQANALLNAGKNQEAAVILEGLLAKAQEDKDLLYNLGMSRTEMGQTGKAVDHRALITCAGGNQTFLVVLPEADGEPIR
ncbi:MAG: hypothetical protein V2A34_14420 [Lentisphaerota bacterium]